MGAFGPPPTEVAQTHETTENTPTNSMASKGETRGRAFPVDLLGHVYRWPGSEIDSELRRNILAVELGGATYRVKSQRAP